MKKTRYCHITAPQNEASIISDGLKANEHGEIFLFEDKSMIAPSGRTAPVAYMIATGQVFLKEFLMLEINSKGFKSELLPDQVGEFCAKCQWILMQDKVAPKYIKRINIYQLDEECLRQFWLNFYETV